MALPVHQRPCQSPAKENGKAPNTAAPASSLGEGRQKHEQTWGNSQDKVLRVQSHMSDCGTSVVAFLVLESTRTEILA